MERNITDGDSKLGPKPQVRLVRTIAVCAIAGLVINFGHLDGCSIGVRVTVFATVIFLGLLAWLYLEIRNLVIAKRDLKKSFRWKVATVAVHPALIPVYFIGIPILVIVVNAMLNNRKVEPDIAPNRSLPPSLNSKPPVRGSEGR
jgi:hypothetical protein